VRDSVLRGLLLGGLLLSVLGLYFVRIRGIVPVRSNARAKVCLGLE
jgi:hypothetical protein